MTQKCKSWLHKKWNRLFALFLLNYTGYRIVSLSYLFWLLGFTSCPNDKCIFLLILFLLFTLLLLSKKPSSDKVLWAGYST